MILLLAILGAVGVATIDSSQKLHRANKWLAKIDAIDSGQLIYSKKFQPLFNLPQVDTHKYTFSRTAGKTSKFVLEFEGHQDSLCYAFLDSLLYTINSRAMTYSTSKSTVRDALLKLSRHLPSAILFKANQARELLSSDSGVKVIEGGDSHRFEMTIYANGSDSGSDEYRSKVISYFFDSSGRLCGDRIIDTLWGTEMIEGFTAIGPIREINASIYIDEFIASVTATHVLRQPAMSRQTSKGKALELGDQIGEVSGINREGYPVSLKAPFEKFILLHFWFANCGPCHALRPVLNRVQKERGDLLKVIGVNPIDSLAVFNRAVASLHYDYFNLSSQILTESVFTPHYPTLVLLDADGRVMWIKKGFKREEEGELVRAVDSVLKQ